MLPTPNAPLLINDEFSFHANHNDGALRERLRAIAGVPDASYVVKDDHAGVFVFDKLVNLAKAALAREPATPLDVMASELVSQATVSAREAVRSWGIVPEPYGLIEQSSGGWRIRHREFDAILPTCYQSREDLMNALERLLLGGIEPGEGDFVFGGQAMCLQAPFWTNSLPQIPVFPHPPEGTGRSVAWPSVGMALEAVTYAPGFDPVRPGDFASVKSSEKLWEQDNLMARQVLGSRRDELWQKLAELPLQHLTDGIAPLSAATTYKVLALRQCYPEARRMSDRFLYEHFDRFERERDRRSWEPHRDDEFLIFLLGSLAQQHVTADPFSISSIHGESAAMALGNWTGYALLCGESLEVAIGFAADCRQYDQAICSLAERVARAMKFVARNKRSTVGQGRPMATWLALASQARSADVQPIQRCIAVAMNDWEAKQATAGSQRS